MAIEEEARRRRPFRSRDDVGQTPDPGGDAAPDGTFENPLGHFHDAAASRDKTFRVIKGATHYYQGQPELLKEAVDTCLGWMAKQRLID